jgi:hypothetical protein
MHAFTSNDLDRTYAMAIGDAFSAAELSSREWGSFADRCSLPKALVARELAAVADQVRASLEALRIKAVAEGSEASVIDRVVAGIARECDRQKILAPEIVGISSFGL